jgi:GDP/UDP-N,N'-diacetylbacillosamine 2-epimerase (hydrolysing)
MKIGVLTSSRADFGIYSPLLEKLKEDSFFTLEIIAFGTHLSKMHGFTLSEIQSER